MTRRLLCVAGFAAFLTAVPLIAADAADMPLKAPPVPVAAWGWGGFYVGGELGGYRASQSATTVPFPSPGFGAPAILGGGIAGFGNLPTSHSLNATGPLGGGFLGYNWMVSPRFLLGVEGHFDALHRDITDNETVFETFSATPAAAFNMAVRAHNEWIASARARAGFVNDRWMAYITGGPAWTHTGYTATATGVNSGPVTLAGVTTSTSFGDTKTGYAIGAGGEWMLSPKWILRAEYVHYRFGGSSTTLPLVLIGGPLGANCTPGACNWAVNAGHLNVDSGVIGISYKF